MHWSTVQDIPLRRETHFDGRVVLCFRDRPASVHQMFADSVARHPDQQALVGEDGTLTYAELEDRTARIAGGLMAAGLQKGERVALLMGNRFAFVEVYLACVRAGLVCVPMNPRQRAQEIAYAATQCGAAAIVFEADLAGNIPRGQDIPTVRNIWAAYGNTATTDADPYELLLAEAPVAPVDVAEEDTAVILYTSGTTGRPKGAMLTHLGIVHSSLHFAYSMGF
ncbi:MAG: class I adenylate-forming enzyme family protein, partial [Pseudomonadota bacterium]